MGAQESSRTTVTAFGLALIAGPLSALLPGPDIDPWLFGLACALAVALLVLGSLPSVRASQPAQLWLALTYLGIVALMRGATNGPVPGFAPLLILPAIWLALYGSRRQLLILLGAIVLTLVLPWALIGGAQYPASTPRSAVLILTVAAIAGLTIQGLLGEVRATRDRLSGVLSAATGNAIVATDLKGTITVFNAGAESMLGYRAEEVVGRATPTLFLAAEELALHAAALGIEPTFEAFTAHTAAAGSETRELTYVRKDRTRLQVTQTLTVERDEGGRVIGFLGVATDVTEQVHAQAALVEERDFTDAVLDTAGSLVIVTDRDARIERFNRAAEEV